MYRCSGLARLNETNFAFGLVSWLPTARAGFPKPFSKKETSFSWDYASRPALSPTRGQGTKREEMLLVPVQCIDIFFCTYLLPNHVKCYLKWQNLRCYIKLISANSGVYRLFYNITLRHWKNTSLFIELYITKRALCFSYWVRQKRTPIGKC